MPCRSETDGERVVYVSDDRSKKDLAMVEAMLCAVLTVAKNSKDLAALDTNLINAIDEKESGVSVESLKSWWTKHQERDRIRRQREQIFEHKKQARAAGLAKLTLAERRALGL